MLIKNMREIWKKHALFFAVVVFPFFVANIYFFAIAKDVFISESRFVVRTPEKGGASMLGALLKGGGLGNSQDESFTVQDYILSRDAMSELNKIKDLRSVYDSGDIVAGGLFFDRSSEALHRQYQKMINTHIDSGSSILTLTVRAFSPEDALKINQRLLELSEELVNKLNKRSRDDAVKLSLAEVSESESKAKQAALALAQFRNEKKVIDPEKQSAIPLQQVAKLQDELIAAKSQLTQLNILSKDNPQIPVLKARIALLESSIANEFSSVAGSDRSFATKAADYHRVLLEKEFSDKRLTSALASLELAKSDAQRKQIYLETIVQPHLPDASVEPRRLRNVFSTLFVSLVLWGILTLLIAGINEHSD